MFGSRKQITTSNFQLKTILSADFKSPVWFSRGLEIIKTNL